MSVALLVITDGRGYLDGVLASASEMLPDVFSQRIVIDDSDHELGFAGAIEAGWAAVETDYVFHLEDDFLFRAPVPLARMIGLLEREPHLAQVALKRQPWNAEEQAAGGIVELHPEDFTECEADGDTWTEHRRFWTTNPSLYAARWCWSGWPQEQHSEGIFTHRLLEDPALRFAFWGGKFDPPLVEHVGAVRAGHGY